MAIRESFFTWMWILFWNYESFFRKICQHYYSHICNILNQSISPSVFPEQAKIANVRPIYEKNKRGEENKNYRPVSVLSSFSNFSQKFSQEYITSFVDKFLSKFISGYRGAYSTNHVLLRFIEQWKSALDNKNMVGAVLMDLSKAFDCIPHHLLIAKLHAYEQPYVFLLPFKAT